MVSFQGNGKKGNDGALSALIHSCLLRYLHKTHDKKVLILAVSRDSSSKLFKNGILLEHLSELWLDFFLIMESLGR